MKRPRRILSLALILALTGGLLAVVAQPAASIANPGGANIARLVAAEGMVLTQNDGILPLKSTDKIALFGYARQKNGGSYPVNDGYGKDGWIPYGGGSGEATGPYVIDLYAGMNNQRNAGRLQSVYLGAEAPTAADVTTARANADIAVVTIRRFAAESSDLGAGAGAYMLSTEETNTVSRVCASFGNVVVVMNVGNAIDMTWVESYPQVKAVLFAWYPGMEGGNAAADILCGVINPSGKLVDTFARSISDYPSSSTFGQTNPQYTDDIYVGYRYFATADPNYTKVKYEFGYGLSYSTFSITNKAIRVDTATEEIVATAKVTNTGPYAGKEVLQVYYAPPAGLLNKPAFELAAFAKTNMLQPYQSQIVEMRFPIGQMASYDDLGKTGALSAWVMENGNYDIYIGNSIKDATKNAKAGTYSQTSGRRVVEQLSRQLAPATAFQRMINPVTGATESTNTLVTATPLGPSVDNSRTFPARVNWPSPGTTIYLEDVYKQPGYIYDFLAGMTTSELSKMCSHTPESVWRNNVAAGAIGLITRVGIPENVCADGPAGVRIGGIGGRVIVANCFPVATLQACTWNTDLVELMGESVAEDMRLNHVDIWLAPGMDIHRNPRCGRNFEYYSEDPLVSGKMAAAVTKGCEGKGGIVCIKHFACNEQETNRYATNSQVSERALREIYLKGFEICVKEANPGSLMTAYNRVNGSYCEGSTPLLKNILRKEWGFEGFVMTDWWNGRASVDTCVANGCNVRMETATMAVNAGNRAMVEASVMETLFVMMRSFSFMDTVSDDPMVSTVSVNPSSIKPNIATDLTVTVSGRNLLGSTVTAYVSGRPQNAVTVPVNNTGGTVTLPISDTTFTTDGIFSIHVTLNGVVSSVTGQINVVNYDSGSDYIVLYAVTNGKYVGTNDAGFLAGNAASATMTAALTNYDWTSIIKVEHLVPGAPDVVHLKGANGFYISLEGAGYGNGEFRARTATLTNPTATGWEAFTFIPQGDGTVKIRNGDNRYVNVNAANELRSSGSDPGNAGKFIVVEVTP